MTWAPRTGAPPMLTVPPRSVFGPVYGVVAGVGTTVRAAVAAGVGCGGGVVTGTVAIGVGAVVGWTVAALPACPVARRSREARSCSPITRPAATIATARTPCKKKRSIPFIIGLACLVLARGCAREERRWVG